MKARHAIVPLLAFATCILLVLPAVRAQQPSEAAAKAPYKPQTRLVPPGAASAVCVTGDTLLFEDSFTNNNYNASFLRINHRVVATHPFTLGYGETGRYSFSYHADSAGPAVARVGFVPLDGAQVLLPQVDITVTDDPNAPNLTPVKVDAPPPPPTPLPSFATTKRFRYSFAFGEKEQVTAADFGKHAQLTGYEMNGVTGIAISTGGDVYVSCGNASATRMIASPKLAVFSPDGAFKFDRPEASHFGMTCDIYGNIFLVYDYAVRSYGPNSSHWGSHGTGDGQFDGARGMALDGHGNVYVADFYNNRVEKFATNGFFLHAFGSYGTHAGQFRGPTGVAVAHDGTVFVSDPGNNRVEAFTQDGTFLRAFGSSGDGSGELNAPMGIAVDDAGYVYVADSNNNRINVWSEDGNFLTSFGDSATPENSLDHPTAIAIGPNGSAYVLDTGNGRVVVFSGQ